MGDTWRSPEFRQTVIRKIRENIQTLPIVPSINLADMENQVFKKANSKEEYLNFIGKVVLHLRNRSARTGSQTSQNPIGALQTLADEKVKRVANMNFIGMQIAGQAHDSIAQPQPGPSGNVPTRKLPTVNPTEQVEQMIINQMGHMQNAQAKNPMMGNANQLNQDSVPQQMGIQHQIVQQQQMSGAQMQQLIGQQQQQHLIEQQQQQHRIAQQQQMTGPAMGSQHQNVQQPQVSSTLRQALQNQMHSQMNLQMNYQMSSPLNTGIQQPQPPRPHQQQQHHLNQMPQQQLGHSQIKSDFVNPSCSGSQKNIVANKFLQSPLSSSVPSPGSLTASGSNQMVASPMVNTAMAPSPSSISLNTPCGATPSPMQDDQISQACKEKIQELRKYIEPLHRFILKRTSEGHSDISKMKKLLEILTNPSSVTNLDMLQKCEVVLKKIDFQAAGAGPTTTKFIKENQFSTPLLEVVQNLLQSPTANNTLQRTFGPCVKTFQPEMRGIPPPLKRQKTEECTDEITETLQGEIARLDQRFKISIDPTQSSFSKSTQLVCWLDDKHLPCVPPILVTVPENYPTLSPKWSIIDHEYVTPYLTAVKEALNTRLSKLPIKFSVSQLLDLWEMSVRHAANPKIEKNESTGTTESNYSLQSSSNATKTIDNATSNNTSNAMDNGTSNDTTNTINNGTSNNTTNTTDKTEQSSIAAKNKILSELLS